MDKPFNLEKTSGFVTLKKREQKEIFQEAQRTQNIVFQRFPIATLCINTLPDQTASHTTFNMKVYLLP